MILFTLIPDHVSGVGVLFVLFNNTPLKAPDIAPFIHRFIYITVVFQQQTTHFLTNWIYTRYRVYLSPDL
jgi:hypothetical protein